MQVIEEFRKGFKFKEQLLRPAMVKVAVASPNAKATEDKSEEPKAEGSE
jgi:ribosomal protein S6